MDAEEAKETLEMVEMIEEREADANRAVYGFPRREEDERRDPNNKRYDIKGLWSRHKEILNLDAMGYKQVEIAKMLSIHPVTVSMTLNSTLGKNAQLALRDERDAEYSQLREEVMDLTRISLDKYREILANESAGFRMQKDVADTVVLELSGMRVPTRTESLSASMVLTPEEIAEFKERGMKAAKASGKLVEVENEPTNGTK